MGTDVEKLVADLRALKADLLTREPHTEKQRADKDEYLAAVEALLARFGGDGE